MRTVIRRFRPEPDLLDGIPAEIHEALFVYSRAVLATDDARRALCVAKGGVPGAPEMWKLEGLARLI